jgi:hypothetical protein
MLGCEPEPCQKFQIKHDDAECDEWDDFSDDWDDELLAACNSALAEVTEARDKCPSRPLSQAVHNSQDHPLELVLTTRLR